MGKVFEAIDDRIAAWVNKQSMFFVSTAPRSDDGLVNCSPKGQDTLRIIDSHTLAFLDLGGSGIETVAHLKENGRIVIMLCAFEGPPKIFRFHGRGEAIEPGHAQFDELVALFPDFRMPRVVVRVNVTRVADSCGFSVPMMNKRGERKAMENWLRDKTDDDLIKYRAENNLTSLDGLPGVDIE